MPSRTPVLECGGAEQLDFDCLANRYTALAQAEGVDAALD